MDESLWHNENYWVSPFNYVAEVRGPLALPARVRFHDATLRDGEQTPGLVLRTEEKVEVARLLDEAGVDRIEVAMPAVSEDDERAVRAVAARGLKARVFAFARGTQGDVDLAAACGADGIVLELPLGEPRLRYQFPNWTPEDAIEKSVRWAKYAKDKGLEVVLFPMDATRARPELLWRLLGEAGTLPEVDSVALVDTTGSLAPQGIAWLTGRARSLTGKPVEIHTHNDFGLGVAGAMAAVAAGAEVVHTSVGGIGERTGNTPLEEIAVALKALYALDSGIRFGRLAALVEAVMRISGFRLAANKPVVGPNAFMRESGMGVHLVKEQPLVLFGLHPAFVGRRAEYVLGKKSGAASITMKLQDLGLAPLSEDRLAAVLKAVKEAGIRNKGLVTDEEFLAIVNRIEAS